MESATAEVCRVREHSADESGQVACLPRWSQRCLQLSSGAYVGSCLALEVPGLIIYQESSNQALHQFGLSAPGLYHFGILQSPACGNFAGEQGGCSHLMYGRPAAEFDYCSPANQRFLGFSIDAAQVGSMLNHYELSRIPNFAVSLGQDQQTALKHRLRSSLECTDDELAMEHPAAHWVLIQSIFDLVMGAVPMPAAVESGRRSRGDLVKKARGYILEHKDEPLTVLDLCNVLHVSRRTLQYAFQSVSGINPVRYLRAVRLNGARQALNPPQHANIQMQAVASYWGFWHLSHFPNEYKTMFGELQSEMMRRGRLRTGQI